MSTNQKIEFKIGSDVFTWDLSVSTGTALSSLDAGKKYAYTITINRTSILVDGKIVDWTTGTGGDGVAE